MENDMDTGLVLEVYRDCIKRDAPPLCVASWNVELRYRLRDYSGVPLGPRSRFDGGFRV